MLMAKLFQELERHGKKNFEVVFLVMNPGYNEVNYQTILNNAKMLNIPITVFRTEILIPLWILRIPRVIFAHGCAEGICTAKHGNWDVIRSHWGITLMMSSRPL